MEGALELFACDARIALLNFAEQALFGGDQCPTSVDIDAAALEDETMGNAIRKLNGWLP